MATVKIFTVYDSKAEIYMQPVFFQTTGQCLRSVADAVNSNDHVFSKYPADFTLFEVGMFDDSNGEVRMYPSKNNLGCLIEYKKYPVELPLNNGVNDGKNLEVLREMVKASPVEGKDFVQINRK